FQRLVAEVDAHYVLESQRRESGQDHARIATHAGVVEEHHGYGFAIELRAQYVGQFLSYNCGIPRVNAANLNGRNGTRVGPFAEPDHRIVRSAPGEVHAGNQRIVGERHGWPVLGFLHQLQTDEFPFPAQWIQPQPPDSYLIGVNSINLYRLLNFLEVYALNRARIDHFRVPSVSLAAVRGLEEHPR